MSNVIPIKNEKSEVFSGVLKSYKEKVTIVNANKNIQVLNLDESNIFIIKMQHNLINIVFDNLPDPKYSYSCTLVFKQDSIGMRKVIFPENVYWSYGEVAVLATKPNHADVITLMTFDGGETYYATHALANLGK